MTAACSCVSSADFQFAVEIDDTVLPVALTNFVLVNQDKSIHLTWQTTTEQNTDNYTCERSVDGGRTFVAIGSVAARNSAAGATYEYIDEEAASLPTRQLYYRLRARDFDGSSQVFGPVAVEMPLARTNELKIYPNPVAADRIITVQGAAAGAKLELRAMDGRLLATLSADDGEAYALPDLKSGIYMISGPDEQGLSLSARFVVR